MRRSSVVAVMLVALIAATGCSSKKKDASASPAPESSAMASVTLSSAPPVNKPEDAKALTTLATKAAKASYDATYDFNAVRAKGLVRIVAAPPSFRVDFSIGPQAVAIYQIAVGTVSCGTSQDKPVTCALVSGPGEKIPSAFDPGVQRLFTNGLEALAKDPTGYAISGLPDGTGKPGIPVGKCFHVERLADLKTVSPDAITVPGQGFESGDYCFDPASGVLTSVKVTSGTLALTKAPTKPAAADFTPPASPRPLAPPPSSAPASSAS